MIIHTFFLSGFEILTFSKVSGFFEKFQNVSGFFVSGNSKMYQVLAIRFKKKTKMYQVFSGY